MVEQSTAGRYDEARRSGKALFLTKVDQSDSEVSSRYQQTPARSNIETPLLPPITPMRD